MGLIPHASHFHLSVSFTSQKKVTFLKGAIRHVLFQFTKLFPPAAMKTSVNLTAGKKLNTARQLPEILISLRSPL